MHCLDVRGVYLRFKCNNGDKYYTICQTRWLRWSPGSVQKVPIKVPIKVPSAVPNCALYCPLLPSIALYCPLLPSITHTHHKQLIQPHNIRHWAIRTLNHTFIHNWQWHYIITMTSTLIWQDMTLYDAVWRCMTLYDKIWPPMTRYDQDMTRYDTIWPPMTLYDLLWHYMTSYDTI